MWHNYSRSPSLSISCVTKPLVLNLRVGSSRDPWLEPVRVVNRGNGADKAEKKREERRRRKRFRL